MAKEHFIVSEHKRPFWQVFIASFIFTIALALLLWIIYNTFLKPEVYLATISLSKIVFYLFALGTFFCFKNSVYIDLKQSRFRSTFEIGPIKLGQWKTINNYEYVSVFQQPLLNGAVVFEVNLWYDKNKHWELYEKNSAREAFAIGYEISEYLQIELLDATVPNAYKFMDKTLLRHQINGTTS